MYVLASLVAAAAWSWFMASIVHDAFVSQPGLPDDGPILALRWLDQRKRVIVSQLVMIVVALPL